MKELQDASTCISVNVGVAPVAFLLSIGSNFVYDILIIRIIIKSHVEQLRHQSVTYISLTKRLKDLMYVIFIFSSVLAIVAIAVAYMATDLQTQFRVYAATVIVCKLLFIQCECMHMYEYVRKRNMKYLSSYDKYYVYRFLCLYTITIAYHLYLIFSSKVCINF